MRLFNIFVCVCVCVCERERERERREIWGEGEEFGASLSAI